MQNVIFFFLQYSIIFQKCIYILLADITFITLCTNIHLLNKWNTNVFPSMPIYKTMYRQAICSCHERIKCQKISKPKYMQPFNYYFFFFPSVNSKRIEQHADIKIDKFLWSVCCGENCLSTLFCVILKIMFETILGVNKV